MDYLTKLFFIITLLTFSIGLTTPISPVIVNEAIGINLAGIVFSLFPMGCIFFDIVSCKFFKKLLSKKVLTAIIALSSIFPVIFIHVKNFTAFSLDYFFLGVVYTILWVFFPSEVREEGKKYLKSFTMLNFFSTAAVTIAPIISSRLAERSIFYPYYLQSFLLLLGSLLFYLGVGEIEERTKIRKLNLLEYFKKNKVAYLLLPLLASSQAYIFNFLPIFLGDRGFSFIDIGNAISTIFFFSSVISLINVILEEKKTLKYMKMSIFLFILSFFFLNVAKDLLIFLILFAISTTFLDNYIEAIISRKDKVIEATLLENIFYDFPQFASLVVLPYLIASFGYSTTNSLFALFGVLMLIYSVKEV